MRKKTDSIILAVLTAISVILPHASKIIPEGNSLIAAAAVAATLSIPSKSVAAIMPARIVQIAVAMPQSCEAGVMEQLCSSVTSFLNDEAVRADTALKNCTKNCGWKKRKDDLIDAARKKAKESCSKGEAPDVNELSKGLDRNTKDRLKDLYNRNSRMFDGTAKLPDKDFKPIPSKQAALLTGKGGNVGDLKTYEPDIKKLSLVTAFSLNGTKLSGETPGQAATKQSPILLASASSAKSPAGADASAKTAVSATAKTAQAPTLDSCAACRKHALETGEFLIGCREICCKEQVAAGENPASSECYSLCLNYSAALTPPLTPCECCKKYKSLCVNYVPGCTSVCGPESGIFDWWHKLWGKQKCCRTWFNPKKKCCADEKIVDGVKCGAACYDPKTECCVKEKKIPESCECYRLRMRLETVNKYLAGLEAGQTVTQTDPTSFTIARTFCLPVPWTFYYPRFYTLASEIKEVIRVHETVHKQQCGSDGGQLEIPAYTAERDFIDAKLTRQCSK